MKMYFARHAESEANIHHIISNRQDPHPLTENGREQARGLGERMKGMGLSGIFASPVPRAVETARYVAEATGAPLAVADALREFDGGVWESRADREAWKAIGHTMREWLVQDNLEYRNPEGESAREVIERFNTFVRQVAAVGSGNYLFQSHCVTLRLALPALIKDLPEALYRGEDLFGYTQYAAVEVLDGEFLCVEWRGESLV